jgi:hypothetical protein
MCKVALALVTGRAARGQQVCGAQSCWACACCQAADKLSEALLQLCTDVSVQQEGGCVSLPLVPCCVAVLLNLQAAGQLNVARLPASCHKSYVASLL